MVGDSPWDVEAARRAGLPTVTVLTGGFSRDELVEAGASAVVSTLPELTEHLELLMPTAKK
jgi:phosphoglycolate phosphatase-like HAD superfamily hydrolase